MPAKGFVALARLFLAAVLLTTLSRAASPALNPDFTDALDRGIGACPQGRAG
jgi:hypothetical protein